MEKVRYLQAASAICAMLTLFALGIMIVGYQPWDIKHVATTIMVAVLSVVCGGFAYKFRQASKEKSE